MTADKPTTEIRAQRRRRWFAGAVLVAFALPTTWMGMRQSRLEVDAQNVALKSVATRESRDVSRLIGSFGSDQKMLLGFESGPGIAMSESEIDLVRETAVAVGAVVGVQDVSPVNRADEGLAFFSVTLPVGRAGAGGGDEITRRVLAAAERRSSPNLTMYATGQSLFETGIAREVDHERRVIVPWVVLVLFVLLWAHYRALLVAVLVMIPAGFGIEWTGGLLQLFGHRLNPVLVLLDPLLLTIGVAVSVHLVEAYRRFRAVHGNARAATAVRRDLWRPMLLTTVTSIVGFLSLLLSPIPAVKTFAVFAALGVALTSCVANWTVPTCLAAFASERLRASRERKSFVHYVAWLHTTAGRVLVVTVVILSALLSRSAHVRVDNDPMKILASGSSIRRSTDKLVDRLGGVEAFGMLVPADSGAASPDVVAVLAAELAVQSGVGGLGGPPIRSPGGDVLVQATLRPSGSESREALFDRMEEFCADLGFPEVHAVGTVVQVARDSGSLIRSQLWGLLLVVPLLGIAVGIGLRSWRLGLLSLIPNALPCVLLHGVMAALDRTLSVATVMIGTVMMGLIVDDTIHLLHNFRESSRRGHSRRNAVGEALRKTGRPITITSVVLCVGFAVGVLGELTTTIEFSALASTTIALAWVLDFLILPAMLLVRLPGRLHTAGSRSIECES